MRAILGCDGIGHVWTSPSAALDSALAASELTTAALDSARAASEVPLAPHWILSRGENALSLSVEVQLYFVWKFSTHIS
jgi:hypothetical protein